MIQPIYAEYSTISRWFWTPLDINVDKSTLISFSNFTIFFPKICFKNVWRGENYERPSGIRTHN